MESCLIGARRSVNRAKKILDESKPESFSGKIKLALDKDTLHSFEAQLAQTGIFLSLFLNGILVDGLMNQASTTMLTEAL